MHHHCDDSLTAFDKPLWRARRALKTYGRKFFSEEPNSYVGAQNCPLSSIQIQILIAGVAAAGQTTTQELNIIFRRKSPVSMIQWPLARPMTAYIGYYFSIQFMGAYAA